MNDPARAGARILPFYLAGEDGDSALIRGEPATSILDRHGYPDAVASLQAEALAIAAACPRS